MAGSSDDAFTITKTRLYDPIGQGEYDYDWGNIWQQSPDVSMACIGALALEFSCSVGFVLSLIGGATPLGPAGEWLAIVGTAAAVLGSGAVVINERNK